MNTRFSACRSTNSAKLYLKISSYGNYCRVVKLMDVINRMSFSAVICNLDYKLSIHFTITKTNLGLPVMHHFKTKKYPRNYYLQFFPFTNVIYFASQTFPCMRHLQGNRWSFSIGQDHFHPNHHINP